MAQGTFKQIGSNKVANDWAKFTGDINDLKDELERKNDKGQNAYSNATELAVQIAFLMGHPIYVGDYGLFISSEVKLKVMEELGAL